MCLLPSWCFFQKKWKTLGIYINKKKHAETNEKTQRDISIFPQEPPGATSFIQRAGALWNLILEDSQRVLVRFSASKVDESVGCCSSAVWFPKYPMFWASKSRKKFPKASDFEQIHLRWVGRKTIQDDQSFCQTTCGFVAKKETTRGSQHFFGMSQAFSFNFLGFYMAKLCIYNLYVYLLIIFVIRFRPRYVLPLIPVTNWSIGKKVSLLLCPPRAFAVDIRRAHLGDLRDISGTKPESWRVQSLPITFCLNIVFW